MVKAIKKVFSYEQFSLVAVLIFMCILAMILSPVFMTGNNIMNVLRSLSLTLITSCGMVLILLLGEMDMSVGSVQGLVGVFSIMALNGTGSVFAAILCTLGTVSYTHLDVYKRQA